MVGGTVLPPFQRPAVRAGRAFPKQSVALQVLVREGGVQLTGPAAIEDMLWQHRAPIWAAAVAIDPAFDPAAQAMLTKCP